MKKLISVVLCWMLVLSQIPLFVFAVDAEAVTVDIYDETDLFGFATDVNKGVYKNKSVVLNICNDIVLTSSWEPISAIFVDSVSVCGNNHKLSGFDNEFFTDVDIISISDLSLEAEVAFVNDGGGSLYGYSLLVGYANEINLNNVTVCGSISVEGYEWVENIGGIIGTAGVLTASDACAEVDFSFNDCHTIVNVGGAVGYIGLASNSDNLSWKGKINIVNIIGYANSVGGLIGYIDYTDFYDGDCVALFENCSAEGEIVFPLTREDNGEEFPYYIGGLIGYCYGEGDTIINRCKTNVYINAPYVYGIGGIVGGHQAKIGIYNSYSKGDIIGDSFLGGVVGVNTRWDSKYINSYSISDISGNDIIGGFIGKDFDSADYANCYATGSVAGTGENIGMFFGYAGESDTGEAILPPRCSYVYSASDNNYGPCGKKAQNLGIEITEVDFSDEDQINEMAGSFNAYVAYANALPAYDIELSFWNGKNTKNGPTFADDVQFIVGDVNFDFNINTADYLMLKKIILGTLDPDRLVGPESALLRCDVTGDGKISTADYLKLKRLILT